MKRGKLSRSERIMYAAGMFQVSAGVFLILLGWDHAAVGILVATLGMLGMARVYRDRTQYNSGWIHGRVMMFASMGEAQARGLHPIEWMIGEAERDGYEVTFREEN